MLLFEDTSLDMPPRQTAQGHYQNFYGRPVGRYAGVCNSHGFDLVETHYLQTQVSHRTFMFLWNHMNRKRTGSTIEGVPFSPLHLAIERRTIPITRRLDRFAKSRNIENTMMRFERRKASKDS